MSCGFQGNADIYGIGIRIGYYTQALAVWFSNYFHYGEAKGLRAVNNIFLLALLVAATIYFADARSTYVIEAFLMLQIGLVIGLVGITELSRFSSKYIKNSKDRMISRMFIIMAGGLFNVCFWWWGLDAMLSTPCNGVGSRHDTYIFYVFKTSIYGWAGWLMKIKSLIAVVWTAPKIITFDLIVLLYDYRLRANRADFVKAVGYIRPAHQSESELNAEVQTKSKSSATDKPLQRPRGVKGAQVRMSSVSPRTVSLAGNGTKQSLKIDILAAAKHQITRFGEDEQLLKEVDDAIKYMGNLFTIYPIRKPGEQKRSIRTQRGCIHFPYHQSQCTDTTTPYMKCLWTCLRTYCTGKPSFDLRWRIALHVTASGQHPLWRWPRLVHRMCKLQETSEPPDWRHVAIASDILLTQIPLVIKTRTWILMAAHQFAFIAILVLQVELTIAWNHVEGLNRLSTLGQLIPFILGLGGFIKVLWGKWSLVRRGYNDNELKQVRMGEYEMAMAKYLECKEASVDRAVVRAVTA